MNQNRVASVRGTTGEHGRCADTPSRAAPPHSCHAHQGNHSPALAYTPKHKQAHTPHLGTHSRTQIQTCTHIIKYVQTSTCSQTDKHKHTQSHTHLNSYTDNLRALRTFICRQGALGIRKAGWAHCVWAWSQRLNYFYSLTV